MPMQISLDELLSALLARVDGMAMNEENLKSRLNIIFRVLYKKGLITDDDVVESIRDEHRLMKELGLIKEEPEDEVVNAIADSILLWIKGDSEKLKEQIKEYEKKMQEAAMEEARKPKIDVASPQMLQQLDKMSGNSRQGGGGKLII
ncbi:MAG: hypothetical protein WCQ97_02295 [Aminobacterium sp.]|jgi:hypothetical protein|uniref:Uncharacterized protein n=1 Tax=bioreactor metagenome TaxID=1076179 RepID=A0A645DA55_9ZZZZ|nr:MULTISPECIES: hypothetical protein [unclassified Aminobacterium]MDD2207126.1 hypothetical protein [Aminobacterium sp.]MDD3707712.1 hypothetical protein [Aminobacterium sp.]MDD4228995.1 hypothetical protein [Aminobacterium sp.]MDD4551638.1 hypothetical protein [Aminobacterium sp.]MEA4878314.1 hypothetical protein [Aminobacterium sp.]